MAVRGTPVRRGEDLKYVRQLCAERREVVLAALTLETRVNAFNYSLLDWVEHPSCSRRAGAEGSVRKS